MRKVTKQLKITLTPSERRRFGAIAKRIGDGSNVAALRKMIVSFETVMGGRGARKVSKPRCGSIDKSPAPGIVYRKAAK